MLCNVNFNSFWNVLRGPTPSQSLRLSKITYYLQTINKTFFGLSKQHNRKNRKKRHRNEMKQQKTKKKHTQKNETKVEQRC